MDPAKLKVVELRAELAARGLDQKGVKAILVSRLQAALDQEQQNLTAVHSDDDSFEQQQQQQQLQDSSITANQFPPEVQFEVQTEPPVLPDTSTHYSEEPPATEPQYEAPIEDDAPIFEQQQQLLQQQQQQQEYYQQETEAPSLNQQQVQQQLQQESEEEEEDDSQSSRSENDSNADENNYDQNDDISNEPAERRHDVSEAVEAMETEETETVEELANQNIADSDTNHELNEPTESEQITEAKLSESNEPIVEDADEESKNGNEAEATKRSPSQDKGEEERSTPEKDAEKQESRKRRRSRSKTKSKSPPAKRANRRASPARNIDDFTNEEDEPEFDENAVLLSWYDSDLNLAINKSDLCSARPLSDGALALAWAGARSTYGVIKGKVCYEVQVNEINRIQNLSDERNLYELRCGWSIVSDNLQLGESPLSFGYSGCAKKASDSVFSDYGVKYGSRGDVVGVYLDLDSTPCIISYTVNGEPQGTAFEFNKDDLNGAALYPHILTKNLAFTVNFGQCSKLLVNEERPNRSRRDEGSRRDKDKDKRSKDSTKSSSPATTQDERKRSDSESQKPDDEKSEKGDANLETKEPETEPENQQDQEAEQEQDQEREKEKENVQDESTEQEKPTVSENGDSNEAKNGEKDKPNESQQKEYSLLPDYELIGNVGIENLVQGYQRPKTRKECEVILLIGLPGAGKTHWATQHSKDNVEKHYNILGVQNLLDKMTVCGESRKKHHSHGRWERFIDWTTRGLHSIQDLAVKKRRNYILDQTNVLASAQRRKMKGYGDFKRIAAVIIPDDTTYKERYDKQTEKTVSDNALNEMKANFILPSTDFGWFDEVIYTELNEEDAKKKVEEFNEKGKKAVKERERDNDRGDRRRDDNRDRYGRDRRNWGQSSSDRRWRQQGSSSQWHNRGVNSGSGGRSRDKWHGSGSGGGGGGGGSSGGNWGNRRYDYPNHRDRRHDDRRGGSRSDRDYKDSRDKRGDKHGGGASKRDKDNHSSSRSSYSSKGSSGHWNANKSYNRSQTMGSNSRDYGSFSSVSSSQQSSSSSNWTAATSTYTPQQQQWLQWQQQGPLMQTTHQSQPQHQQANNTQWWQQQQQQTTGNHQGWQNWAQYAQAYGVNASNSNGANMSKK
ncbi:heterogeneous nuclear ribonucleoprotein U [Sitodiplosis mosellana]|uniref:heterogeneous nuclear ribonucleoprotein U n=1 Tax=Sitodiplosis mosellana TaxID=263140 RepID=UPI0024440C98|nr:heterogeneous nuclear ribonucleoprotein U [Sitodiplosis mosellana]